MAPALQYDPTSLIARIPTTSARGHHDGRRPDCSAAAATKLTLHVAPFVGAGHLIDASADRHFNRVWHGKAI